MLQYSYFDVALHHSFPYVCDVAFEVFSCSWDRGAVGEWGDVADGGVPFYSQGGAGEFGKRAAFYSIHAWGERVWEGRSVRKRLAR
jgi:hypothetical protein